MDLSLLDPALPVASAGVRPGNLSPATAPAGNLSGDPVELLRLVAENSGDLVIMLDQDGRARFVSASARAVLGARPEQLSGHLLTDFVHPDDRSRVRRGFLRIWTGGSLAAIRFRARDLVRGFRWVESQARLIPGMPAASGGGPGLVLRIHDIEAQRRAEQVANEVSAKLRDLNRLLALTEELGEIGHFRLEFRSGCFYFSPEARRILGVSEPVLSVRSVRRLVARSARPLVLREAACVRRRDRTGRFRIELLAEGGQSRPVDVRLHCESAGSGREALFGIVAVAAEASPSGPEPLPAAADSDLFFIGGARLRSADCPPLCLLLADDNPIGRSLLRRQLSAIGHRVTLAVNGRDAVRLALGQRFDCILMDVQMPELDGAAATRLIRTSGGPNAAAPIIALAARGTPEQDRFIAQAGFTGLLPKPVDPLMLRQRLASMSVDRHPALASGPALP